MSLSEQDSARRQVFAIANGILGGSIHPIDGCRALIRLRSDSSLDLPAFDVVNAIQSETDDYPRGSIRANYEAGLLWRLDQEIESYLQRVREPLFEACRQLIANVDTCVN